ncbi:serine/threonine-protein kinase RIO3-like isoform X1 [Mytilus galloprovincialis]|uniref:serine/threonine-protein kinase RIO3-like isoform X1 n=2 Tax=Mytilus galloprovincialis TaxID=29158 RepID=UPI003F7C3058
MEGPVIVFSYRHSNTIHKTMEEQTALINQTKIDSVPKPSPWGKPPQQSTPIPSCLQDVMNEQLSEDFIEKEQKNVLDTFESEKKEVDVDALLAAAGADETADDELMARMLQLEYDKQNDEELLAKEKLVNKHQKVSISFENYRSVHPAYRDDEDTEEEDDDDYEPPKSEWDKKSPSFKKNGTVGSGKNVVTKHDKVICGRKNASKLMDFPPEFHSGDGESMDMQLNNRIYNKLKRHSDAENKRHQRLHEKKEHSTAGQVMDARTRLILYKLVNNGVLDSISGSISTGKESVVFHAYGGELNGETLPKECAIKVYKTTLNEFKNRGKYVDGDHRFSRDDFKKQNPRKIIRIWGEKETANLNRMKKFGVPCPHVQVLKKHVLVMSFIGKDMQPAPKLKTVKLSTADMQDAFEQTMKIMKTIHRDCKLVHADLSEFNILWYQDKIWIIDVSQAVEITHPAALEFLFRDCKSMTSFFQSRDVHGVPTPEELFNDITGLEIQGEGLEFVAQVQRFQKEKNEECLVHQTTYSKEYAFDYFFEKSQKERADALDKLGISDGEDEDEALEEEPEDVE